MPTFRLIPEHAPGQSDWQLDWDKCLLHLRAPDGECVIEIDAASAHRSIDLNELWNQEKVCFLTVSGPLTFQRHREAAAALCDFLKLKIADDTPFLEELRQQSFVRMVLGIIMFLGAGGLFALYCWWAMTADDPQPGTWLHWLLVWFGWLIHLILLMLLAVALAGPMVFFNGMGQWLRVRKISQPIDEMA